MTSTTTNIRDVANPKTFKERDEWMRSVVESDLPHGVVRLAVRFALHLNVETGRCDPGYDALASELRLSRRSIIRDVAVLEQAGWVSVARWRQHQTNQFSLLRADRGDKALSPLKQAPEVTNSVARGDKFRTPEVTSDVTLQSEEKSEEKSGGDSLPSNSLSQTVQKTDAKSQAASGKKRRGHVNIDEGFPRFWNVFPKHVGRVAAQKAFVIAVEGGVDPEALIAGARNYALEREGENQQFTKHPKNWLAEGCWDDEASGPTVIDNAGNIIAFAARRDEPEPTEAEILREWGLHSRADEMLLRERG
jgi:hypothetical protein